MSTTALAEVCGVLNDTVMGGRSSSNVAVDRGMLVFRGNISTKGGGFASFRSSDANVGSVFAGASGVSAGLCCLAKLGIDFAAVSGGWSGE